MISDFTRWFQREIGKIDRQIMRPEAALEKQQELWLRRDRLMNEPGYAAYQYIAWQEGRQEP